jgi:predicted PhzF superfamily epimerase YddE/YHI9
MPGGGFIVISPLHVAARRLRLAILHAEAGIAEDRVAGSAHCTLGPSWSARLGKSDLVGHQVSSRGGIVKVSAAGDRVPLGGQAVTVLRGELLS